MILKHNFRITRFTCAVVAGPGPGGGGVWAAAPWALRPGPQALPGGRAAPGAQRPYSRHLRTLSPGPPHLRVPSVQWPRQLGPGLPSPRTPSTRCSTASSKPARCPPERQVPVGGAARSCPPAAGRGAPDHRARPASGPTAASADPGRRTPGRAAPTGFRLQHPVGVTWTPPGPCLGGCAPLDPKGSSGPGCGNATWA